MVFDANRVGGEASGMSGGQRVYEIPWGGCFQKLCFNFPKPSITSEMGVEMRHEAGFELPSKSLCFQSSTSISVSFRVYN